MRYADGYWYPEESDPSPTFGEMVVVMTINTRRLTEQLGRAIVSVGWFGVAMRPFRNYAELPWSMRLLARLRLLRLSPELYWRA